VPAVLLTCPHCRSGLEVPDGTTALVRCPACKTVFAPADGRAPEPEEDDEDETEEPEEQEEEEDDEAEGEDEGGTYRTAKDEEDDGDQSREARRRRRRARRRKEEAELTPEEKAERRRAFTRAAWGARLIVISFGLFMVSMFFITGYFFQGAFAPPIPALVTIAGVFGLANWVLAAVGVGLCLSGPRGPGHWGYGVAAATAVAVHLIFLLALVAQGKEYAIGRADDRIAAGGASGGGKNARWRLLPTQLNGTMFYLTAAVYPDDQGITPRASTLILPMITGVAEMVRTVLVMMFLSCLARAALDDELAHRCTRCAGVASAGPGLLALLILGFVGTVVETNAGLNLFTQILSSVVQMGVYSIINGVMLPSYLAAQDVVDACEEPFQSLIPQL
jgi:hypothetical protein